MWGRIYPYVIFMMFVNIFKASCEGYSSLTFVIDDTLSMTDDIVQVKSGVDQIMNIVYNEKSSLIKNMVLVTFNDPDSHVRSITKNRDVFKRALSAVTVHNYNNWDCQEMSMKGLLLGLEKSLPGSYIYVFTDASAKDYLQSAAVKEMCQRKQSQIVFVLTGYCYGHNEPGFKVYYDIAAACSGLAFYINKNEINQVLQTIKATIKGKKTVIATRTVPANIPTNIPFVIDDHTEYAMVSASGFSVSLTISGPWANQQRLMWNKNGKVIKMSNVTPGQYVATVMGHTETSVIIVGRTDFLFSHGFSVLEPKTLNDTSLQPIADTKVHLSISVTDPEHSVKITSAQIMQMDEKPILELPLTHLSTDFYITKSFVSPSQRFKVAIKGVIKATGKPITRIAKIPITPQPRPRKLPNKTTPTASIAEGKEIQAEYYSTVKLTCKVTAYPEPKIKWINSKGAIMHSMSSIVNYPYEYISYLEVSNASKTDTYTCYAVNDEGKHSKAIKLIVKDALVVTSTPAGTTHVAYGSEGTITCDIRSSLPMHIRWYYANEITGANGQIVTSDKYWISADGTQLKIKNMDLGLVGKYTCIASLKNNEDVHKAYKTRVAVDGLVIPKVSGEVDIKAIKGTTAVLECKIIRGLPKPKITWHFLENSGSKYVPTGGFDNVLRISSVEEKHAGRYKCVAENVEGSDEHVTTLIVQVLPKIAASHSAVYQSTEGDAVLRIPCVATGLPKPIITWKLNGLTISPNAKYSTEDGALIVREPKVSDTNSYTCEAKNEVGSVSAMFKAYILQAPKLLGETSRKVRIGTSANIECKVFKGEPKPKITWQFKDNNSASKFTPIAGSDDVLHIPIVADKEAGHYKCVAQNTAGRDEHVTTLIIQDLPKITSTGSSVYQGIEGDALLRIPCVATGLPMPDFTWKLNGRVITSNAKYSIDNGTLIIRDPKVTDTNLYTCEAVNEVGLVSATFKAYILQTPKLSGEATKEVRIGTSVNIECKVVKGEPTPKITWQFMDKSASMFTPIAGSTNVLIMSNVEDKQAGRYKCVAQNTAGIDEHVTTLIVESAPRIISKSSTEYEGIVGDMALRIPCDVTGIPQPVIIWKLKDTAITPNEKYIIEDGALVIKNPNKNDSTSYTCEAKNYIGTAKATFRANVEEYINDIGIVHHVYMSKGETKKLQCEAYSSKSQSVRWIIGSVDMHTSKPYLEVDHATVTNDGNYTCRVSDMHGHTSTHTYVVDVGYPPKLDEETAVNHWRGAINDILTNCQNNAKPQAEVEWKFNGKLLTNRELTELGNASKWGTYTCNVSNVHGSVQRSFDVKSSDCLINRNLEDIPNMPLLLTDERSWPQWESTEHYLIVKQEEQITLTCQNSKESPNAFQKFPKQSELKALCYKQDTFLVDGNFYRISDLQCSDGNYPLVIKNKVKCLTDTSELIRVGYNVAGFLETYEVCFDYEKNMPLYSRVLMTPTDGSLSAAHSWYNYPGIGDGKRNKGLTCKDSHSSCCYEKSQLVNARDFNNGPAKNSTFIDPLNAIPYWRPCYNKSMTWDNLGDIVRNQLNSYNDFAAWSGTHTLQEKHGAFIPRYLWKVLRFDEDESIAIIHVNDPSATDKDIKCKNICTGDEESLFKADKYNYCCKLTDFLEAFGLHGTDIGELFDGVLEEVESA